MEIGEQRTEGELRLSLQGRLDATTAPGLQEKLLGFIEAGERKLVLDFSQLDYVSSAGLRVILIIAKKLKADSGRLALCSMKPHIREVFDIAGFSGMLAIFATVEDAAASLQ